MTGTNRIAVLAVAALVAVVGFFVAQNAADDGTDAASTPTTQQTAAAAPQQAEPSSTPEEAAPAPAPKPKPPLIVVEGGQPEGGVRDLSFEKGGEVDFRVRSTTADEIHVHGYDETVPLPAGETVRVRFPADIDGRFEVELHGSGTQIAQLEVTP